VVLVLGVSGAGRTATIAKLARRQREASSHHRGRRYLPAAAIDQLRNGASASAVDVVAHRPARPGAGGSTR
jgi:signal recognition particle GTPase